MSKGMQANFPTISPDGRRLAAAGAGMGGLVLRDVDASPDTETPFEPDPRPGARLWPYSWSAANQLLGLLVSTEGAMSGIGTYDITTKQYRTVSTAYTSYAVPMWLRDGRRFLVRAAGGIDLMDSETGVRKPLTVVRGYMIGRSLGLSADNTWYSYTETGTEGDIWIARLR
jgi:Tol biopolymer transport system component